ncbi:MAG: glycoside hydrolase, partial [Chthoniobacteraceae bacterium]
HTTRTTLFRGSDRVEIRNEITENFRDVRHWAFSYNLAASDVHTEEVGAVIRVKTRANGGDYADTHARYDYATLNQFADITDGTNARGVTLSSPDLAFVRLGHSAPLALDTTTPQLSVLAGGQVDGSWLGIHAQNGATHFLQRFALRPHAAYDQTAVMKFALEHQNPLVTGAVIGKADAPYPAASFSLLQIDDPHALLWALKPHDDGIEHGLVARVWNQASAPTPVRFTTALPLKSAERLTHLETAIEPMPLRDGALGINLGAQRMETFGLKPAVL